MKKVITSILKAEVDTLQKVGVNVFRRMGKGIPEEDVYFAEVCVDGAIIPKVVTSSGKKQFTKKFNANSKIKLSSKVPRFKVPNSNVAKVYVAARDILAAKNKPVVRSKLLPVVVQRTGLSKGQVSWAFSSLCNSYAVFEVVE